MWTFMNQNQNDDVWATSNKDGVRRVLESDGMYAFMMEVGCNQTCERCLTGPHDHSQKQPLTPSFRYSEAIVHLN